MSTPRTEAGRRLFLQQGSVFMLNAILAIEAEARADLAARIEARLVDMFHPDVLTDEPFASVLDLIREEAGR